MDLHIEVKQLMLQRKAKSNGAILAIVKEQERKFQAIRNRLGSEGAVFKKNAFKVFTKLQFPSIATLLNWKDVD